MPGDVVGTAFVRIRALTDQLNKDIESQVTKGMKNANLEKAAKATGEDMGSELGDGIADETEKTLKKRAKNIVPADDITDGFKDTFKGVKDEFEQLDLFTNVVEQFDQLDLFEDHHFDVIPDFDSSAADSDSKSFFSRIKTGFQDIGKSLDDDSLGKNLDDLSKKFKSLGSSGSEGVGLLGKSIFLIGGAITAALPLIQDVGATVLAYVVGLTAQVGFLATAVGGAGVAAAAALGSAAVAILPIFLAFKSETQTLTDFKDGLKASTEEFLRIGTATQQTLLPALDDALFTLGELVPMFSEFGLFVGRSVGGFAKLAAAVLTGSDAQGRFQKILRSSLRILDVLFPALINVGNILSGIWVAALPAAERFVGLIGNLIGKWKDMIEVGLKTGTLTDTINKWFDRARLVGSALANVAGALFDILQIGADSSDNVFTRFDEWAKRFRDFTSSEAGQNKLKLIFDNALEVMHEVNGVASDLFDGIFGRLTKVGGVDSLVASLEKFRDFIPTLKEEWTKLMDAIREVDKVIINNVWGKLKKTWEEMAEPLGRLVHAVLDFLGAMDKSGSFETFLKLMQILTDVLSTLLAIPGFGTFVGYLIAFGTAAKVATIALNPFIRAFGQFSSLIIDIIRLKVGGELSKTATGLQALVRGFREANKLKAGAEATTTAMQAIKAGGAVGAEGTTSLSGSLGGLLAALGPLAGPLSLLGIAAASVGVTFLVNKHRQQVWNQEIRQATTDIGLLNDGLNITTDSVAKYVKESSRFASHDQVDDLDRMGFSVTSLSDEIVKGTISLNEFIDSSLAAGEITALATGKVDKQFTSLESLQKEFDLTSKQMKKLKDGYDVIVDGTTLSLEGNTGLIRSFREVRKAIGEAAKDSVDEFVLNKQNTRLLGAETLNKLKSDIDKASDAGAAKIMIKAQEDLAAAAVKDTASIKGLNKATVEQINAQVTLADGTVDVVKQNELMRAALEKQNKQIRDNIALFNSVDFAKNFGLAKDSVINFSSVLQDMNAIGAKIDFSGGLDKMLASLGPVKDAAFNLFNSLKDLPEAEFNAAATALGTDAGVLRDAMNGAEQAINDLAETALSKLPSVGELLDKATSTDDKGKQFFNKDAFIKGVQERTRDTEQFAANIKLIQEKSGDEAARLAAQQGPEAAKNLASMVGTNPDQLEKTLKSMEDAEAALTLQIRTVLGPGIASEYLVQAKIVGDNFGSGLAKGINSPETITAIQDSSIDSLNVISDSFQGYFKWDHGVLTFVYTGKGRKPRGVKSSARNVDKFVGGGGFSAGGFVGKSSFGMAFSGGPKGTDTVPAWLTPGEFVLRQAVAKSIPASVLNALNAGDPRMMSLLTSLNGGRPASTVASASASTTAAGGPGSSFIIQQMNIEAPEPLESARMVSDRLKILHTQLTRR